MLWWLAENTVVAALLGGLVALAGRFGRLGPAVLHALWLVVLLKLITPPLVTWPWPLPGLEYPAQGEPAAPAEPKPRPGPE